MEALLDIESKSQGRIHSAAVSATLAEGRISIEFCVNAPTIDEAQKIVTKTLRTIIQRRLGHELRDDSIQEKSRDYELVPA
jgi:pyruvoyl-dependent arginine decarboxylase (PvlArgDC)